MCLGSQEDGPAMCVSLHTGGMFAAVGYHEGFVRIYNVITGNKALAN